jgi:nitrate reductase NapAB chaperone NapD
LKIEGRLVTPELSGISRAKIDLVQPTDSAVIASAISAGNGEFDISANPTEPVIMKITHISFRPKTFNFPAVCDTVVIAMLDHKIVEIDAVETTVSAPTIRYDNKGNIIVNLENIPDNDFDNAIEALRKVPGVMVTHNESVSLFGDNAAIQLDGRDINMDPMTFLMTRPASFFAEVELTADATGRYGEGGSVINFVSKRRKYNGHFSNLNAGARYNIQAGKAGGEGYFFTMIKRNNFYFNADTGGESSPSLLAEDHTTYNTVTDRTRLRSYLSEVRTYRTNNNFNFSWDLPRKRILSINSAVTYGPELRKALEDYTTAGTAHGSRGVYIDDPTSMFYSGNISYGTDKNRPYSMNASYGIIIDTWDATNDDRIIYNNGSVVDWTNVWEQRLVKHTLKFDYVYRIPDGKLSLYGGGLADLTLLKEGNDYVIHEGVKSHRDSDFDAGESILAIYGELSYRANKQLYVTAGARAAYTFYDFENRSQGEKADNNFWNVMPWVNLNYTISKNLRSVLSYTSAITRPGYRSMLPGMEYYNNYEYWIGNPKLRPQKNHTLSLRNIIAKYVIVTLRGRLAQDMIVNAINEVEDGITEYSVDNGLKSRHFGANIGFPFSLFGDKLYGQFGYDYSTGRYTDPANSVVIPPGRDNFSNMNSSITATYRAAKRLNLRAGCDYTIRSEQLYTDTDGYATTNASVIYKFLKKGNLVATFTANDIFNSGGIHSTRYNNNVIRDTYRSSLSRNLNLRIVYSFSGGRKFERDAATDPNDSSRL